jgi:hypothetical protein
MSNESLLILGLLLALAIALEILRARRRDRRANAEWYIRHREWD